MKRAQLIARIVVVALLTTIVGCGLKQPAQEVEGAFGWKLGEYLDHQFEIATNAEDGTLNYIYFTETNGPFGGVTISVDEYRQIYEISALALRPDHETRKALIKALADKYGTESENIALDTGYYSFGRGNRTVHAIDSTGSTTVIYTDNRLKTPIEDAIQKRKEYKAKESTRGL